MPRKRSAKPDPVQQERAYLGASSLYREARVHEANTRVARLRQIIDADAAKLARADELVPALCRVLAAVTKRMLAIPAACAGEANPQDPKLARAAVRKHIAEALASFDESAVRRSLAKGP